MVTAMKLSDEIEEYINTHGLFANLRTRKWVEDAKLLESRLTKAQEMWLEVKQPLEIMIMRTCPCYGMITSLKDLSYCNGCQFIPLRRNKDGIEKIKEFEKALGESK